MKVKLTEKLKKIFEVLMITNIIIYAFYLALFFKAGSSYAQNLPVIKSDKVKEILKPNVTQAKASITVPAKDNNKIVDPPKYNRFPWGQCTWYVATKRNVTWNGHAKYWYQNAKAAGRPVGKTPKEGSIIVLRMGYYGHVGYVEKVEGELITYSESNNPILGRVTRVKENYKNLPVIGFIY